MNSILKNVTSIFSPASVFKAQFVPVRYRYYAERIAKGPYIKKYGYKDKIFSEGVLPRLKDAKQLPHPIYRPGNSWSREKALFGQNDYIDILGGGKLRPPDIAYDVPKWLRGRKGNEFKLLILKHKIYSMTNYEYENPTLWHSLRRRVKFLYRKLNYKTKTGFSEKQ